MLLGLLVNRAWVCSERWKPIHPVSLWLFFFFPRSNHRTIICGGHRLKQCPSLTLTIVLKMASGESVNRCRGVAWKQTVEICAVCPPAEWKLSSASPRAQMVDFLSTDRVSSPFSPWQNRTMKATCLTVKLTGSSICIIMSSRREEKESFRTEEAASDSPLLLVAKLTAACRGRQHVAKCTVSVLMDTTKQQSRHSPDELHAPL